MNKKYTHLALGIFAASLLSACTQSTPSMMNTSRLELARETSVEQIPISEVNETNVGVLAEQYRKHGSGPLDLTMTFDPKSKTFTAMKARRALDMVVSDLKSNGVTDVMAQTLAVPDGKASLMVSYDVVHAQAPSDCAPMPGMNNNETGRFIGDYKFGCGVETLVAKQIARPSDLEGRSEMDQRDGRRESIVIEGYSAGVPQQPLEGIERADLAAE